MFVLSDSLRSAWPVPWRLPTNSPANARAPVAPSGTLQIGGVAVPNRPEYRLLQVPSRAGLLTLARRYQEISPCFMQACRKLTVFVASLARRNMLVGRMPEILCPEKRVGRHHTRFPLRC